MMDSLSQTLLTSVQMWMAKHPILAWAMTHPLWAIAVVLLTLLLSWGLLGALARLVQQACLFLLQVPLKIMGWLWVGLLQLFSIKTASIKTANIKTAPTPPDTQQRLTEALNRLDVLRQEEEKLMQEVRMLLSLKG